MKMMTAERARALLNYDHETGALSWKVSRGRAKAGDICGTPDKDGYLRVRIDKTTHMTHRVAWLIAHGKLPDQLIDHKNGNKSDNRLDNLRDVSHMGNAQNKRKAEKNSNCEFLGVCWDKATQKFMAGIVVKGKFINLGRYNDPEVAHAAYVKAKRELHPTCTL